MKTANIDYFSDDDQDNIIDEENNEQDSDDNMDDETRQAIFRAIIGNEEKEINYNETSNKPIKKNKQKKLTNTLSLEEFSKKMEKEEKANQPKKFVSKRAEEKRKQLGLVEETLKSKRSFNPRLPPYNFIHKKNISNDPVDINNSNDFPSLQ
jgi:hypothetical protein